MDCPWQGFHSAGSVSWFVLSYLRGRTFFSDLDVVGGVLWLEAFCVCGPMCVMTDGVMVLRRCCSFLLRMILEGAPVLLCGIENDLALRLFFL